MCKKYTFKLSAIKLIKSLLLLFFIIVSTLKINAQGTDCATATSITIDGACLPTTPTANNISDGTEDGPLVATLPCSLSFGREGWFTFTVPAGPVMSITIIADASNKNLALQLISSTSSCSGLASVTCVNTVTALGLQTETLTQTLSPGIYYLKVVNVGTGNMTLTSLCVQTTCITPVDPGNPTSNSPQCLPTGVTLTRTGSAPVGETWYWQTVSGGTSTANNSATYTVTTSGTYYIRSRNNTTLCWSAGSGSLAVVISTLPTAAITPSPTTGATGVCYSGGGTITSVSWAATAGATSYDVYFGAGSLPGSVTSNVATNSYSTGLAASTTYYWKVVAKNACGDAVGSATWTFTTANTPCYCTSTATSSNAYFTAFSTTGGSTNITNTSGYSTNGYGNFSESQTVTQVLSGTVNYYTTVFGISGLAGVAIFVDWNQNGVFTDIGENVYNSAGYVSISPSGSFTVPAMATLGTTRMRIVTNYFSGTPVSCNSGINGETEDYSFVVTAPSCYVPSLTATTGIDYYTATINWSAPIVVPSNGYQYVVSTSNVTPSGAGTPTFALTANITGLTQDTTYYVFVRSDCGSGDYSNWSVIGTFDTLCAPGSGIGTTTLECPSVLTGGLGLNGADFAPIECNAVSTCVDLEATYQAIAQTTSYTVSSIPYAPPYQFGCLTNPVSVNIDDVWSPVINLPFNFCFYGNSYNSCLIGSNGMLTFNTGAASGASGYAFSNNIPSTTGALFANTIYGVYHDIDPSVGGEVGWELITLDTGCRAMVASWKDVPMFSDNSILYTGMMVLYENTNIIDVYIKEKNIDNNNVSPWNGGNAIVGIQNATATQAVVAPGKNGDDTNWSAVTQAWRFSPSGAPVSTIEWFEGAGTSGTLLGTTDVLSVCPLVTTTYTAKVTYTLCGGGTLIETDETTVTVAENMVWNGAVSSNWDTASNWTPAIIPTLVDCVTIPVTSNNPIILGTGYNALSGTVFVLNGASLTVNSSNTLTVTNWVNVEPSASLSLKNTASLIQINDASINTGNITMERTANMRKTDYVYWSSPVENFSSSAISPGTPTSVIWKWNTTIANTNNGLGNWVNGNEIMSVGKGYIVRGPNSFTTAIAPLTATFNGVPFNGIKQPSITRGGYIGIPYAGTNGVMITNTDDNWNLIGNPYPSAIDAISFLNANTNIDGNVRLWTHGTSLSAANTDPFYASYQYNYSVSDYLSFNSLGSTPPGFGGKIGAGQGFFVFMNDGPAVTENVTFNNNMRNNTYSNSQFFRTNNDDVAPQTQTELEKHRIWLSLLNSSNVPVTTLVGYATDATFERDRMFDATHKVGTAMGIYSLIGEKAMIIQGRPVPFDNQDMVPLGVTIPSTGTYKIAISVVDGLFDTTDQTIYLEDTELGIIYDIRSAPYLFTANAGDYKNRFILRYTNDSALGIDTANSTQTFAFIANNLLQVQSTQSIMEITVYDISGKLVKTYQLNELKNRFETDFYFANGAYIAKIKLENGGIVSVKLLH